MLTTVLTGALLSAAAMQQTDTTVSVEPGSRLEIASFRGEVVIRTWPRNEVQVLADHSTRTDVRIGTWGSTVRLEAESYRGPASVDYDLTVPADMDIEVRGTFVSVDMDGVGGEVRAHTTQGDLRVAGGKGYISLRSTQGRVEVDGAEGSVVAQTVTGSLMVTNSSGDIEAETTSGNVTLENIRSADVRAVTTSGRVHFSGEVRDGGRYVLSSHSGNVVAAVQEGFNASVTASTFSGNLESAFPITVTGNFGRGRRMTFTMGDGSARMELESFSGNIELRRWSGGR